MLNNNLQKAINNKKDEFYTTYSDIKKECLLYKEQFKGKTIFCNCDNPHTSRFFRFFVKNFKRFNLKTLISLSYSESSLFSLSKSPKVAVINDVPDKPNIENIFKLSCNSFHDIKGNGDFRSMESIGYLKKSDIVVTNPPFSLFREFISILEYYNKKYLILGNINALAYKDFFSLIMKNKVWLGVTIHSGDRKFYVPDDYPLDAATCGIDKKGRRFIRVKGVRWFTNIDIPQRYKYLKLTEHYDKNNYQFYDNYHAINIDSVNKIPCDYTGIMGVPITFLDKYNPKQFQIIGADFQVADGKLSFLIKRNDICNKFDRGYIGGKRQYARIFIKHLTFP